MIVGKPIIRDLVKSIFVDNIIILIWYCVFLTHLVTIGSIIITIIHVLIISYCITGYLCEENWNHIANIICIVSMIIIMGNSVKKHFSIHLKSLLEKKHVHMMCIAINNRLVIQYIIISIHNNYKFGLIKEI